MSNERASAILEFIRGFSREKGFPPTIREIGEAFDIASTNGVRYYLGLLEKQGHIKRNSKISRGIFAVGRQENTGIPVLGRVAAGEPITAEHCYDGMIEPGRFFGDARGLFALKVRGDSMVDAGIVEGDYVVVRHQERANPGEMVVALIGDEATVKYYQPKSDHIELVPANEKYEPIMVGSREDFRIAGVVRGVIRTIGR
jgi:repressor LexA